MWITCIRLCAIHAKTNIFLYLLVDNLTKFVKLYAVPDTSTKNVLKSLTKLCEQYGLPVRIISDRSLCFTSKNLRISRCVARVYHLTSLCVYKLLDYLYLCICQLVRFFFCVRMFLCELTKIYILLLGT